MTISIKKEIDIVRFVGGVLLFFAIVIALLGFVNQHSGVYIPSKIISDFYANLSAELGSVALTVLLIDYLSEKRYEKRERKRLIKEMRSTDVEIVRRAANDLWVLDWLEDGCLQEANLRNSALQHLDMRGADLRRADLTGANLTGTDLRLVHLDEAVLDKANLTNSSISINQLSVIKSLENAIMPNGELYNEEWKRKLDIANANPNIRENNEPLCEPRIEIWQKPTVNNQEKMLEIITENKKNQRLLTILSLGYMSIFLGLTLLLKKALLPKNKKGK